MLRAVRSRTARAIRPATSAWVRRLCVVNAGSETTVANAVAQDKCTVLYFTASWCARVETVAICMTVHFVVNCLYHRVSVLARAPSS